MTMITNTDHLLAFLRKEVSVLLAAQPFASWPNERVEARDVSPPNLGYIFEEDGMELIFDEQERITAIFLHDSCSVTLDDLPFSSSRERVRHLLGQPDSVGNGADNPVLGRIPASDRFDRADETTIQAQYNEDFSAVTQISLCVRPTRGNDE